jgi:hypothetical protein
MGNICNNFSNENFDQKHLKNLNISTPQFITEGIPIQNSYTDLSNSQPIQIPTAFSSNYQDDSPIYVNSSSNYSSSNYSFPNSYQRPQPTIVHHYNYNNNNDNMTNFLLAGVLFSELEIADELHCD